MTFEHEQHATTSARPEAVWALWSDPATWSSWDPAVQDVTLEGGFAQGAGGTMVLTGAMEVPVVLEVVEPGRRYLDRLTIGDLVIRIDHVVEGGPDGSEVLVRTTVEGPGAEGVGAMVTADAPRAVAALVSRAERR